MDTNTKTPEKPKTTTNGVPIPLKFYSAEHEAPKASTVGDLKAILAELPDDLRIDMGFGEIAELYVFNLGTDDEHLSIESNAWDD